MSTYAFNIESECGEVRTPGVETDIYFVCSCDILAPFPQPPTTSATQGATMIVTDDILLKPLKAFKKMRIIIDTGDIKNERKASGAYDQMFDFKTVTDENYDEWFNQNGSACLIAILIQKDGKKRLLGHPTKGPVMLQNAVSTQGTNNETNAEWTATLMASPGNVAYYYEGEIDEDETT